MGINGLRMRIKGYTIQNKIRAKCVLPKAYSAFIVRECACGREKRVGELASIYS